LFFEDEHGNRGGLVERFDSLDDLHAWARDNGETRLAEWADKERGGKAPAKKAAPRKAAPKPIPDAPDLDSLRQTRRPGSHP
jgi:predicted nucleic acid-binding Zn ribbon protein